MVQGGQGEDPQGHTKTGPAHPASPGKGLRFSMSQGHPLLLPWPPPQSPVQHLRAETGQGLAPEELHPPPQHPSGPQHPAAEGPVPARLLPLPLNSFHLPQARLGEGSLGWAGGPAVPGGGDGSRGGPALRPEGEEGCERGDVSASTRRKAANLFWVVSSCLEQFLWRLGSVVPSAPARSTPVMLLHPSRVKEMPFVGRQHPADPSRLERCYLGIWGRGRGFSGISWSPNHAGCAQGFPPGAGGKRCQHRAMEDPSPSLKTCLHLARAARVPLCFCVHRKQPWEQGGCLRSTIRCHFPTAIPHIPDVSGHHLLKTLCQKTPTPGAIKLPACPRA